MFCEVGPLPSESTRGAGCVIPARCLGAMDVGRPVFQGCLSREIMRFCEQTLTPTQILTQFGRGTTGNLLGYLFAACHGQLLSTGRVHNHHGERKQASGKDCKDCAIGIQGASTVLISLTGRMGRHNQLKSCLPRAFNVRG